MDRPDLRPVQLPSPCYRALQQLWNMSSTTITALTFFSPIFSLHTYATWPNPLQFLHCSILWTNGLTLPYKPLALKCVGSSGGC